MERTVKVSKIALIGAFICTMLVITASCSIIESFDSQAHVRFKNNTSITFNGVRVNGGAEFNNSFGPSLLTDYIENESGNFGVDVKVGSVWTFIEIPAGNSLSISSGSKYTISIDGTAGNYKATQVED